MKEQQEILAFLNKTKNMLMMDNTGVLYILTAFHLEEDKLVVTRTLFGRERKRNITYISSITLDKYGELVYEADADSQQLMRRRVCDMVADRVRYTTMCKNLSQYGYTIKKK